MDLLEERKDPLGELLPPLTDHEASVEANRCLYCFDAPCTHACPTHIDIPKFIKKIATGNLVGSARAIFEENLLGATCARVCPVQELCEGACVLGADHKPISIGRLQRHAMESAAAKGLAPFPPAAAASGRVAVIGAGPASLSCAGELRRFGHAVTIFERRELPGGLSTYGIIKLREPMEIALAEAEMILKTGVQLELGRELGGNLSLADLQSEYHAVFLGVGPGESNTLHIPGSEHISDGLVLIERSKTDPDGLTVGRNVVVIGAGNTAIDCATIAKRLGAETVTMVYRRSEHEMTAFDHEVEFVKLEGVGFKFLAQPTRVVLEADKIVGLECARVELGPLDNSGRATPVAVPGSEFVLPTDQLITAIGQDPPRLAKLLGLKTHEGFISVSDEFETSVPGVFAGGDCIRSTGAAFTVMGVQDGKLAAHAIHSRLAAKGGKP